MRHVLGRAAAVAALALAVTVPWSVAASAADVSGPCSGSATSYNEAGTAVVGNVVAPGPGGTQNDPFRLDPKGSIAWEARTSVPMKTGTWNVSLGGTQVRSGAIDNPDGKTKTGGVVEMSDLPVAAQIPMEIMFATGIKLQVDATASSSAGTCTGSVWITGAGGTTGSTAFWVGSLSLLIAAVLLLWLFLSTSATPAAGAGAAAGGGAALSGTGAK